MVTIPARSAPNVTIVMVTYGQWPIVEESLRALVAHTPEAFELVVVDNASPDDTGDRLRRSLHGARLVRNDRNLGFLVASNQGAAHARASVLCFLNSDAFVEPGWLAPLLAMLEADPACGAVVPAKDNVDRTLQEAGSMVTSEGDVFLYGWRGDRSDTAFRFRREVDFGGAACLAVRQTAFRCVGGFDARYGLGYYEDVDLCFALRAHGWRIRYEPASRVRHVGGASAFSGVVERLVTRNRCSFRARWAPALQARASTADVAASLDALDLLRDRLASPRVMVAEDGAEPHCRRLAVAIGQHWPDARVTLLAEDTDGNLDALGRRGVEVVRPADHRQALRARRWQASILIAPTSVRRTEWSELRAAQPQAQVVLVAGAAPVNIDIDARVVLAVPGARFERRPSAPLVTVSAIPQPVELEDALSHAGLAPPTGRRICCGWLSDAG